VKHTHSGYRIECRDCQLQNIKKICITSGFRFSSQDIVGDENLIRSYHRIIEAFKFSYAYRALLGDPEYEDGIHEVFTQELFSMCFSRSSDINQGSLL
jgi:gamma-glutamyltranspeptidase